MRTYFIVAIIIALAVIACSEEKNSHSLSGEWSSATDGTKLYLGRWVNQGHQLIDSTTVKKVNLSLT